MDRSRGPLDGWVPGELALSMLCVITHHAQAFWQLCHLASGTEFMSARGDILEQFFEALHWGGEPPEGWLRNLVERGVTTEEDIKRRSVSFEKHEGWQRPVRCHWFWKESRDNATALFRDLIGCMVITNPDERRTFKELLEHPYFR